MLKKIKATRGFRQLPEGGAEVTFTFCDGEKTQYLRSKFTPAECSEWAARLMMCGVSVEEPTAHEEGAFNDA